MKKILFILIAGLLIILFAISYFTKGKIFDRQDDSLSVNNKTNDTLCFWFAPLPNNKAVFEMLHDNSFSPSWILPKKIEPYGIGMKWEDAIKQIEGGKLYLLDYNIISLYKKNKIGIDSNVIKNIIRYEFPLIKEKLDSCNWIITYDE